MTTLPRWVSSAVRLHGGGYVTCGNPPILNGLQSFTLEAWVNLATLGNDQSVIGKVNVGVDGVYQLYVQSDGLVCSFYPPANVLRTSDPISIQEWNHLATTYDRTTGTMTIYINGQPAAEAIYPYAAYTSAAPVLIGASLNKGLFTKFLQGLVGEVMIWNVCRTPEEVLNDSVQISYQGDTAVLSLLMDVDFSYLPAADWAGNNIPFSYQNGAQPCLFIPGLRLNGQAYANCGTNLELSMGGTKPYTIEGWFYLTDDSPTANQTIVSKVDQGNAGEYLVSFADKKITSMRSGLNFSVSSNREIVPNTWYHFATTYDHLTKLLSLYLNGNLQRCQYSPDMSSAPSVPFLIGAMLSNIALAGGPINFFQGYIQNIRVWNMSLEQDQIQQWMYNQPIYEPNLLAGFDFTVNPPVDTTGANTIQLLNGAVIDALIFPIDPASTDAYLGFIQSTNADYLSQHEVAPDPPPPPVTPPPGTRERFVSFGPEFKNALWADLEAGKLAGADDETKQKTRKRFEQAFAQASTMADENPNLLKPFTISEENGLVKVIHHSVKGDILVFEAPAGMIDNCTLWWMQFVYMLTAGFFVALGLLPSVKDIASRIWNLLSRNPLVMEALNTLLLQDITVATAMAAVKVIYQAGYMWPILKMCFAALSWWGLGRILVKVIALVMGVEAAELLANFIIWAIQLGIHADGYTGACSHTGLENNEGLPAPIAA